MGLDLFSMLCRNAAERAYRDYEDGETDPRGAKEREEEEQAFDAALTGEDGMLAYGATVSKNAFIRGYIRALTDFTRAQLDAHSKGVSR